MGAFKAPHGGELKNLYLPEGEAAREKEAARDYVSWDLTARQLCDIELLLNGAFSPLEGFLDENEYHSVITSMRLGSGVLWPMPVVLDVSEEFADKLEPGQAIALRDLEGVIIATMDVSGAYRPDKAAEAERVFGTTDDAHPAVHYLNNMTYPVYVGGKLKGIESPVHYDFKHLRDGPADIRDRFRKLGWRKVAAFHTREPMHRAEQELSFGAARDVEANLLIHPVVGASSPGDAEHFARVRAYEHILKRCPEQTTMLSLLPLATRMGGPREALLHAIIRKNYGCTHMMVAANHAGPPHDSKGGGFYGSSEAAELLKKHEAELDISIVPLRPVVFAENRAQYIAADEATEEDRVLSMSAEELERRLLEGLEIPAWYSFPEVVAELRRTHPPRYRQGFTVFFTGLSGSGKSTVANALMSKLMEIGGRNISLLDGDIVRKNLSSELGFSKEHRDLNITRIGYVASEITKHGGIAICAPIAPYRSTRRIVREMVNAVGGFVEIHVSTPLDVCEDRDRKGLYAKARAGIITEFTGISDPYEVPEDPEMEIDTSDITPDLAAHRIIVKLEALGYIR